MDAVILNYRAGRLQQFASTMRDRFTAVKGKYEIVFTGDGWREDSVNVFRGNGRGWDLIMLFIIRWIVMARRENEDLSILIRPTDRRACRRSHEDGDLGHRPHGWHRRRSPRSGGRQRQGRRADDQTQALIEITSFQGYLHLWIRIITEASTPTGADGF